MRKSSLSPRLHRHPSFLKTSSLSVGWSFLLVALCQAQFVFINELHYDNSGSDVGEFIEIFAPAGTVLADYELALYNGANRQVYRTFPLHGIVADAGAGFGVRSFEISGIQNGAPDGIALYSRADGGVLEFISYEGSFTALGGVAADLVSDELPVFENSSVAAGFSIQREGSGREAGDFTWARPAAASPGLINQRQTVTGSLDPFINVRLNPTTLSESAGDLALTLNIQVLPAPTKPITLNLTSSHPARISVPATVVIPTGGQAIIPLSPIDNDTVDDTPSITLSLTDPSGTLTTVNTNLILLDDDRAMAPFNGTLRVATYNILNGVGAPGTASYEAIRANIARVNPDVIGFQETSAVGDFRNLRSLLLDLGFLVDRQFLATEGDNFEHAAAENGQFTSDQFVVLASRFPIKRTVQIGRGVAGRRELTRYPLYVEIDLPDLERDPVFVVVHLKAGRRQSDQFRKAVEAFRVVQFLQEQGLDGRIDPLVLLGDFNENREGSTFHTSSFQIPPRFTDDSFLPATYRLGADLENDVPALRYRTFPDRAFQSAGFRVLNAFHANGSDNGTFIDPEQDSPLDYILVSTAIRANGTARPEVLNSVLDHAFDGLPKQGTALTPNTDARASDHRLVFADIPLTPQEKVTIKLEEASILEVERSSIAGHINVASVLETDLSGTLTLSADTLGSLTQTSWRIPAGTLTSSTFQLNAIDDNRTAPDVNATLTARTDDRIVGLTTVEIRNDEPTGRVIISEYREPPSGMTGRALELFHPGDTSLDLASTPLLLYRYAAGSHERILESKIDVGRWKPGTVIVIGDNATRTYLLDTGFLPANALSFPRGNAGTAFTHTTGDLLFVLDNMGFNGDDALEVQLGWERADVFGRPGEDPGIAWAGKDVSTLDSHLTLLPFASFGSAGFDDPSGRFFASANTTPLLGFGLPPLVVPDYMNWLLEQNVPLSQRGLLDDVDGDRLENLLEFALIQDPLTSEAHPIRLIDSSIEFMTRPSDHLAFEAEVSSDLQEWWRLDDGRTDLDDGRVRWSVPEGQANYVRVRVRLR
ncbi:MAG: endonuclease/exonuclease/phosphatase family protein [Verrucomicrobiales bacterium]|nr:endonuclease/exonuclease/phosphatase family protein [Verrucomicrobiales bacterium]